MSVGVRIVSQFSLLAVVTVRRQRSGARRPQAVRCRHFPAPQLIWTANSRRRFLISRRSLWLPQELQARRDGLRKVITSLTQRLKALRESR